MHCMNYEIIVKTRILFGKNSYFIFDYLQLEQVCLSPGSHAG